MQQIKAILGVIGSGKDYRANIFKQDGYIDIKMADKLKELCWQLIGWQPLNDKQYEEFKKAKFECKINDSLVIAVYGREILQRLADIVKLADPLFFVKEWMNKVRALGKNALVICSDIRFKFELENIINNFKNFEVVFANYKSERYNAINPHNSEKLAQYLITLGFSDGHKFTSEELKDILENYENY